MEHREAGDCRESIGGQTRVRRIDAEHLDVAAGQALLQWRRERGIDLDGGEPGDPLTEQLGGQPRAGSHLEDVVAEITGRLDPRQQIGLQHLGPFRTRRGIADGPRSRLHPIGPRRRGAAHLAGTTFAPGTTLAMTGCCPNQSGIVRVR